MRFAGLFATLGLVFLIVTSAEAARSVDRILDRNVVHTPGWEKLSHGNKVKVSVGDTLVAKPSDAQYLDRAWSGDSDPELEAYLYDDSTGRSLYYSNHEVGFVEMDDWAEMDVDELWQAYLEGAREQSRILGYQVTPLRWLVKPTLLTKDSVAFYGIEVQFGNDAPLVNLVVFDFGRHGYEEITVVLESAGFDDELAETIALKTAKAHKFGKGFRYRDFMQGDKIAAVGAAAVVAGSLGVRWNKGMLSRASGRHRTGRQEGLVRPDPAVPLARPHGRPHVWRRAGRIGTWP